MPFPRCLSDQNGPHFPFSQQLFVTCIEYEDAKNIIKELLKDGEPWRYMSTFTFEYSVRTHIGWYIIASVCDFWRLKFHVACNTCQPNTCWTYIRAVYGRQRNTETVEMPVASNYQYLPTFEPDASRVHSSNCVTRSSGLHFYTFFSAWRCCGR